MGSGGGSQSSTTTTSLPAWELPYAAKFLQGVYRNVMPGGQLLPMPQGLNYQVAGFTPDQLAAMQLGEQQTGLAQGLANTGAGTQALYAGGGMLGPNPYLNQYYNQAANQDVMNYMLGTQPSLMAEFQRAGAFDSSGFNQAQGLAQYGLGQSLATLGANIYEPAYQFESGQALNAAQNIGSGIQNLYAPGQNLYGIGQAQQQQQQNIFNAQYQNAMQQANWPFQLLSQLGAALGQASGGGGTTITQGPAGGGMFK
jgi:hypothetical protein